MAKKTAKGKHPGGRPPFAPTEDQRKQVATLAAVNFNHEAIAEYIGIDSETLRKHFREELLTTKMKMLGNATNRLAEAVNRGEAWAVCFTLKTQGKDLGWSERYEHTGKDGAPINFEQMNDAQLDALIGRIEKFVDSRRTQS